MAKDFWHQIVGIFANTPETIVNTLERDGSKQEREVHHMHRWHHLAFFVNFHSKVQCGDGKQNLFTFECCLELFCGVVSAFKVFGV